METNQSQPANIDYFQVWKDLVDTIVYKKSGFHLDDLPDEDYRNNYEQGVSFNTMSITVLSNNELK